MNKKICIGSDHGGYSLKEHLRKYLESKEYEIIDLGCNSDESCDYPDYAEKVAKEVLKRKCLGILICGTGIGMSIAANKFKGIYAALVYDEYTAKMAKQHNNANIVTLGARTITQKAGETILDAFLNAEYEGERHERRLNKIKKIENEH